MCRFLSLRHPPIVILKALPLPTRLLQRYSTFCLGLDCSNTPNHAGYHAFKVQSAVPLLALAAADVLELQGKNLACKHPSMGKVRCSYGVAAGRELAVVASTAVVAGVQEHVVEVDRCAVVGANLCGSVLEMVPRHNCSLPAAVDKIAEAIFEVGFGCNMPRLDLPWQAFEEAVP